MQAHVRMLHGSVRSVVAAMVVVAVAVPVIAFGTSSVGAATVGAVLDCGTYDGTTFPITDVTVAQGDTLEVTWDADCVHPTLDQTVLRTDAAVAASYFTSVPGQASGIQDGAYFDIVSGSSSGTWVVRYDAPLGQMPLNSIMEDSWPSVCANCGLGSAIRLTITPGPNVPEAPDAPTGTPGDGAVVLTWSAPTDDGGSPVTGYVVTASPGGQTCTAAAPATSCTVGGLTNGQAYTFTLVATNAAGDSSASAASAVVTPVPAVVSTTTSTTTTTAAVRARTQAASLQFVG